MYRSWELPFMKIPLIFDLARYDLFNRSVEFHLQKVGDDMERLTLLLTLLALSSVFAMAEGHSGITPAKVHSINATSHHRSGGFVAGVKKGSSSEKQLSQLEQQTMRAQNNAASNRAKTSTVRAEERSTKNSPIDFKSRNRRGKSGAGHGSRGKSSGGKSHGRR
jgi:hypothetical protein